MVEVVDLEDLGDWVVVQAIGPVDLLGKVHSDLVDNL